MKEAGTLVILLSFLSSCAVLQNNSVVYRLYKTIPDTAFVYSLPFAKGTSHPVWQGYHSLFSHWRNYAVDFKMKPGTVVYAARGGVVAGIRDGYSVGGIGRRYVGKENAVVIRHNDNTYGHYLHVQHKGVLVAVGDRVQQGQPIALSGSTGFSAFPHLHFEVTVGPHKSSNEIPVRFQTAAGVQFLLPLRKYKAL